MFVCHIFGRQISQPFKAVIKVENNHSSTKNNTFGSQAKKHPKNTILVVL